MSTPGGYWVTVPMWDGRMRRDWIPDDQPSPPFDAAPGRWHVVTDPEGRTYWDWVWHAVITHTGERKPDGFEWFSLTLYENGAPSACMRCALSGLELRQRRTCDLTSTDRYRVGTYAFTFDRGF